MNAMNAAADAHARSAGPKWAVGFALLTSILVTVGVVAHAQLEATEVPGAATIVEPSMEGGGHEPFQTVFEFDLRDVDPLANDQFPAEITCFHVQNLGSATEQDITDVRIVDDTGTELEVSTKAAGETFQQIPGCPGASPAGGAVAFEAFFPESYFSPAQSSAFEVKDVGTGRLGPARSYHVQVRTQAPNLLRDTAQGHTLQLRVTVQFTEKVGSPVEETTFTTSLTDSSQDKLWNGGVNTAQSFNFKAEPVQIPDPNDLDPTAKTVAHFRICDGEYGLNGQLNREDANANPLRIDRLLVKQGPQGTAVDSDLLEFQLFRTDTSGAIATASVQTASQQPLFAPGGTGVPITLPLGGQAEIDDDGCVTFELKAIATSTAMRGRTVQANITVIASESGYQYRSNWRVAPSIQSREEIIIGSGILRIPNLQLVGSQVPIQLISFPEPGLETLSVQTQALQFDPSVIQVDGITGVNPYQASNVRVNNRTGKLRFTLSFSPSDDDPQSPSTEGTIAQIDVSSEGDPGSRSSIILQADRIIDADGNDLTQQVVISAGGVTLIFPGDIDLDGRPTVRDALLLATAIVDFCLNNEVIPESVMDVEQKQAANVAGEAPDLESETDVDWCAYLDAADIRAIAELAISFSEETSAQRATAGGSRVAPAPWVEQWLGSLFQWALPKPTVVSWNMSEAGDSEHNWALSAQASTRSIGGIQGRIHYDADSVAIEDVRAAPGFEIAALHTDDHQGEMRFVVLANRPMASAAGGPQEILRVETSSGGEEPRTPTLTVDMLLDAEGNSLAHWVEQERRTMQSMHIQGLSVRRMNEAHFALNIQGRGIKRLEIQGYDLGGRSRFHESAQGSQLEWRALDERTGRRLANGVYLYLVTVEGVNGETWRSDVRKLVVLR